MILRSYARYEKTVTVAAVNFRTIWGDKAANLDRIKKVASLAAEMGAGMVAFPELALSGFVCGEESAKRIPCAMHRKAAEPIPGPATRELARLAKKLGVYLLVGMPEAAGGDKRVYNSVAVIGPEGILGKYRKIHLSPPPTWTEQFCFRPGSELPLFETRYGPVGVQICMDFWCSPELTRILWLKGARIVFNCTAARSGPGRNELLPWQTASRGSESGIYMVSANLVGTEQSTTFCGRSVIAGPDFPATMHVFAQGGEAEEIVTATLSFEKLHYHWSIMDAKPVMNLSLMAREYAGLAKSRRQ